MGTRATLHAPCTGELATSPKFFVEVLSLCYRPHTDDAKNDGDEELTTKQNRHFAERAFRLLHDWTQIPGTGTDGKADEIALRAWCVEARRLAEESGYQQICDNHIGQVYARAPSDDDGRWPCLPVRNLIQEIATDSLLSGWFCGIRNTRGVVCQSPGGDQERPACSQIPPHWRIRYDSSHLSSHGHLMKSPRVTSGKLDDGTNMTAGKNRLLSG